MNDLTKEIDTYLERLFPVTRSITGAGVRQTLQILQEIIPLKLIEYPSGTPVYDWIIPDEWLIRDAWIKTGDGKKVIDFKQCNIHVVSYSEPVNTKIDFSELKQHLHYLEDLPDGIPYRTSYYNRGWGFCVNKAQYETLAQSEGPYEVYIDSEFKTDGSLTIGEMLIPGTSKHEILISTYICHPSLANDNLSGTIMTTYLVRELLKKRKLNYSYRIVFVPETIGAITYCALNEQVMKKIDTGIVVTTVGGTGRFGYKQSFDNKHEINLLIEQVFREENEDFIVYPFDIHGSDERQYSSQGFRINTASITKDKYYEYPYYHTSLDNLDYVKAENIERSLSLYLKLIEKIDKNIIYKNLMPNCEVMLSKHSLYPETGGALLPGVDVSALDIRLWLLFLCDGETSLYQISKKLKIPIEQLYMEAEVLAEKKILKAESIKYDCS